MVGVLQFLTPHSQGEFHAVNNQFQVSGTKGFWEGRVLSNDKFYIRLDFPGVSLENLRYSISEDKKGIIFEGDAPKEPEHEQEGRSYSFKFPYSCGCCLVSGVEPFEIRDGVVRAVLHKIKVDDTDPMERLLAQGKKPSPLLLKTIELFAENKSVHCGESGPYIIPNPTVTKGSNNALEAKPTSDGGLFMRVDLPGVAKEDARVWVDGGEVRFCGKAKNVSGLDEDGRDYLGSVSLLHKKPLAANIKHEMKDGVLRIWIPPPSN